MLHKHPSSSYVSDQVTYANLNLGQLRGYHGICSVPTILRSVYLSDHIYAASCQIDIRSVDHQSAGMSNSFRSSNVLLHLRNDELLEDNVHQCSLLRRVHCKVRSAALDPRLFLARAHPNDMHNRYAGRDAGTDTGGFDIHIGIVTTNLRRKVNSAPQGTAIGPRSDRDLVRRSIQRLLRVQLVPEHPPPNHWHWSSTPSGRVAFLSTTSRF